MPSFSRHTTSNVAAGLVGLASFALAPASAMAANFEYARDYEIAFLDACGGETAAPVCQCAMETIQDEMTFASFAEAVARHGGDLSGVPWWNAIVSTALAKCRSAPMRVASRTAVLTADPVGDGCRDAGQQAAEAQSAAQISD